MDIKKFRERSWTVLRTFFVLLFTLFLSIPTSYLRAEGVAPETKIKKSIKPAVDPQTGQEIPNKYELTLDVFSKHGQETQYQPLDVILVADLSGSMSAQDVKAKYGGTIQRIEALKHTLQGDGSHKGLIDSILENPNNRLSLVGFAGKIDNKWNYEGTDNPTQYGPQNQWPNYFEYYDGVSKHDDAQTFLPWGSDAKQAKKSVNSMTIANPYYSKGYNQGIGTGTNIGAGLLKATELLKDARPEAKKVVILLSDGEANMYYDNVGYTMYNYDSPAGGSGPTWFANALDTVMENAAYAIAPKVDGFYSVKFRYVGTKDSITTLKDQVGKYNTRIPNEVFSATDESSLDKQFDKITKKILPLGIRKVTITDELSKFVALAPENAGDIRVVTVDDKGKETKLTEEEVTVKTETDPDTGLVKVIAEFDPDYALDDSVTYALKFTVDATQLAFDAIAGDTELTNEEAQDSDKTKLYSNRNAFITYTYGIANPQEKTEYYQEKPTFKAADPNSVKIKLEWQGVGGVGDKNVTAPKPKDVEAKLVKKGVNGGEDNPNYRTVKIPSSSSEASFGSVAKGYEYEAAAPDVTGFSKQISKDGDGNFKVVYRQLPTLTVKKELVAEQASSWKEYKIKFSNSYAPNGHGGSDWLNTTFKAIIKKENESDEKGKKINLTFVGGNAEFKLHAGEVLKIPYMPRATHYHIEEDKDSTKGYEVSYDHQDDHLLGKDIEAKVINHKLPQLSVKKEVSGVFANLLQEFDIYVTVQDKNGKPLSEVVRGTKGGGDIRNVVFNDGRATVTLKRGETLTIQNLPLGATYKVEERETSSRGYQVTYEGQSGTLSEDKSAVVHNTKNSVPETGIGFIATPATLILVVGLGGSGLVYILVQTVKRRRR